MSQSFLQAIHLARQFTYQFFQSNRYLISEKKDYQALCDNGFIKLYTHNGRAYWHVQNQFGHKTPDWKFHISVKHQQIKQSWNLVAGIFCTMKCRTGMKTYYLAQCNQLQPGRQISVYILKYDNIYKKTTYAKDFQLSRADQHSEQFWFQFVANVQRILQGHKIQPNGLAKGDLKIGKFVSLRNQSFILNQKGEHVHPPNQYGWNILQFQIPFNLKKLKKFLQRCKQQDQEQNESKIFKLSGKAMKFIILPIALIALTIWGTKFKK